MKVSQIALAKNNRTFFLDILYESWQFMSIFYGQKLLVVISVTLLLFVQPGS